MKVIPKSTTGGGKKVVKFQSRPLLKKKVGSAIKFENELPEEKNSFKIAKTKMDTHRTMSPRGPNNQQKTQNIRSGNN